MEKRNSNRKGGGGSGSGFLYAVWGDALGVQPGGTMAVWG